MFFEKFVLIKKNISINMGNLFFTNSLKKWAVLIAIYE
jgi:hypothetical protein